MCAPDKSALVKFIGHLFTVYGVPGRSADRRVLIYSIPRSVLFAYLLSSYLCSLRTSFLFAFLLFSHLCSPGILFFSHLWSLRISVLFESHLSSHLCIIRIIVLCASLFSSTLRQLTSYASKTSEVQKREIPHPNLRHENFAETKPPQYVNGSAQCEDFLGNKNAKKDSARLRNVGFVEKTESPNKITSGQKMLFHQAAKVIIKMIMEQLHGSVGHKEVSHLHLLCPEFVDPEKTRNSARMTI